MTNSMMELIRATPRYINIGLLFVFVSAVLGITITIPVAAFPMGAFVWMCYIHYLVNLPAINHAEEPFYKENLQRFIELKVKMTFHLWIVGIVLMAATYIMGVNIERLDPETVMPDIDIISSLVLLMISLALFIPATFILMKASYLYDENTMGLATIAILSVMFVGIVALLAFAYTTYYDYVPEVTLFDAFPYLLISICTLASSLFIALLLSKSAIKTFIRYVTDDA